jgi:hypothetical protein
VAHHTFRREAAVPILYFGADLIAARRCESVTAMSFYRDHIYPHIVKRLGDRKPFRDIREQIVPLAEGTVLEIGVGPGVN